jgi:DNA-binding LytR/AlgR family response regulator
MRMNILAFDTMPDRSEALLDSWRAALPLESRVETVSDTEALGRALVVEPPELLLLLMDGNANLFKKWWEGLADRPPLWVCSFRKEDALTAFGLRAAEFTLAPLSVEELRAAVDAFFSAKRPPSAKGSGQPSNKFADCFFVKSDYKIIRIEVSEILFVESLGEYIRIHTAEQRITALFALGSLMSRLPADRFFRIHRSFVINVTKIGYIQNNIVSIGKHQLSISKGQKAAFLTFLEKFGLLG